MANNTKEIWEIELDLKTEKLNQAQKRYDESLEKIKTNEKRLTEAMKNEGRIQTTAKVTELKLQEAANKTALAKDLQENKTKNAKELIDYKQTLAEKNRLRKEAEAQAKTQAKVDSKLVGQSTELGSVGAITQQIAHFRGLRDSVSANSKEFATYSQRVNELTAQKKNLTNTSGGLSQAIGKLGVAYISFATAQKLWQISEESAKFHVLKASFQGTTEQLNALEIATAGNVTKASLMKLSNQASDLGVSLREQTILMSLAEDASDKYGTSLEEGFQKVIFATEGSAKGLKSIGIQKAVYEEIVKDLAKAHGDEIQNLDAETQKQIRLEAIIKASGVTYDMAIQKQKDLGDNHEIVSIAVSNLKDEYGKYVTTLGLLDKFMQDAVSTGKRQIEIIQETKIAVLDLADEWGILRREAQTPIRLQVELSAPSLSTVRQSFTGSYEEAVRQLTLAKNISWEEAQKMIEGIIPSAKEHEAYGPPRTNTTKGTGSNSGITKQIEEQLNLIKLQEEAYKKLETQLAKNLGDLGAERQIRLDMLNIEREIFRLRYGADITGKNLPDAQMLNMNNIPGLPFGYTRMKHKSANAGDLVPDMTSEEFKALMDTELAKGSQMLGYTESMWSNFQGMLADTGLMEGSFGQIVNMINSLISGGKSAFGFLDAIGGLLGFLPGGGVVSSVIGGLSGGGGGMAGMPNYPMPQQSMRMPSIVIQGDLSKLGTYRIVQQGNNYIAERGDGVY